MHFLEIKRKVMVNFLSMAALWITASAQAGTLYGPGTIEIPTNQVIIINTYGSDTKFWIDEQEINVNWYSALNPRIAIAGAHVLMITNNGGAGSNVFVTFQWLKSTAIKTVVSVGQTNTVNVPAGKTIQFFDSLGYGPTILFQPTNSAVAYTLPNASLNSGSFTHSAVTGPGTITIFGGGDGAATVVSYYFVAKPRVGPPVDLIY